MQDIILKKIPKPVEKPLPKTLPKSLPKNEKVSYYLEQVLAFSNRAGNVLAVLISEKNSQSIVHTTQEQALVSATKPSTARHHKLQQVSKKVSSSLKERGRGAGSHIKQSAKTLHSHTKTPLGKLALFQTVALLSLFAYVTQQHPVQLLSQKSAEPSVVEASPLRKFLPSIGEYTEPKPFEDTSANQQTNSQLALHTWLTPWNMDAIKENQSKYGTISAFWLTVSTDGIQVQPKSDWKQWDDFRALATNPNQKFFLTISGDPDYTYLMLSDPSVQTKHIQALLDAVNAHKFDGIDIDYEALGSENRDLFTEFIRNLSTVFHENHKLVAVTMESRIGNHVPMDWKSVSDSADQVRIMVYDYHSKNTNSPGAIAPIGWVKEVLDFATSVVDTKKLIIGLGNYGYDWAKDPDSESWKGTALSFEQAMSLAKEKQAPLIRATGIDNRGYDVGSVPFFTYKDTSGTTHEVWFEDSDSLSMKTRLISQYSTAGVIFWSVGLGDKAFWQSKTTN